MPCKRTVMVREASADSWVPALYTKLIKEDVVRSANGVATLAVLPLLAACMPMLLVSDA